MPVLAKPFGPEQLVQMVRALLGRGDARKSLFCFVIWNRIMPVRLIGRAGCRAEATAIVSGSQPASSGGEGRPEHNQLRRGAVGS